MSSFRAALFLLSTINTAFPYSYRVEIKLTRFEFTDESTIGTLSIDGVYQCFTLEDRIRDEKVYGRTAISAGIYSVDVTFSNRFKAYMPLLLKVPNFEGVRIHPGNTAEDTEGCILVGLEREDNRITRSREAYRQIFPKLLKAWERQEKIYILIEEQREEQKETACA